LKLWPDTAIAALWNICTESEPEASLEAESAVESGGNMSIIACTQLALRSIGECDDSSGKSLLAAGIADGRRHTHSIKELLDVADIVKDQTWKEMVAELLEKATWSGKSTILMQSMPVKLSISCSVASLPQVFHSGGGYRYTELNAPGQTRSSAGGVSRGAFDGIRMEACHVSSGM
jgi:hypothetical protein